MGPTLLPLKLLLATVLGGLIGLERESASGNNDSSESADGTWGIRTYALISLLGGISGLLFLKNIQTISLITFISFFIFMFLYYAIGGWMIKSMGLTTELGAVFSFLIGFFITSEIFSINLVLAITIVTELILSIKEKSKIFILGIKRSEINAFIAFAIIALVILPFLPNHSYYLTSIPALKTLISAYHFDIRFFSELEIINPFKLWFILALITGVELFGYLLTRIIGDQKGLILAGTVGGFVSSTAVTQSIAIQSKKSVNINELVSAAIFSNVASFFQILIFIAPLNSTLLIEVTPILAIMIVTSIALGLVFYFKNRRKMVIVSDSDNAEKPAAEKSIFSLKPALRFVLILVVVRIITQTALTFYGQAGFLATSVVASFAGLDALVINISEMAGKLVTIEQAVLALLIINATNLLSKVFYVSFHANKSFTLKFSLSVILIISSSFLGFYLLP